MSGRYEEDIPAMREFLSWRGPIGSDMRRRKRTLGFRARQSVGVKTGRLRADIKDKEIVVADGLEFQVGNWGSKYAAAHHEGAGPHIIVPKSGNPIGRLVFDVGGKTVFAKSVQHPGNKPNHYLSRWLREAVQ